MDVTKVDQNIAYIAMVKLLFYCHLPIKISLSIVMTQKRWYCELNLSIRIIGYMVIITLMVVVDTTHTCRVAMKTLS